ncbi:hypothetical protein ACHWQZ_G001099 [Mnemiopsis leidyi]
MMTNRRTSMALPAIDEESGRRRSSIFPTIRDTAPGHSRPSVVVEHPRPQGLAIRRTSSAPSTGLGESPAEVPTDRSRMRSVRRKSTSSGLFSGPPASRSRSGSIVSPQQGQGILRQESTVSVAKFPYVEVKRTPLDPIELDELLDRRRESQRTINFLHRQDSKPLLLNVDRSRPPSIQIPTLQAPLLELGSGAMIRGLSQESTGDVEEVKEKGRYRKLLRFHPFKGQSGLRGLTHGESTTHYFKMCDQLHSSPTMPH